MTRTIPASSDEDKAPFKDLDENSQNHCGELVAMDRSIGALRQGLRDAGIAKDTLAWFCSDNNPLSDLRSSQQRPQGHPAKSKLLAVSSLNLGNTTRNPTISIHRSPSEFSDSLNVVY